MLREDYFNAYLCQLCQTKESLYRSKLCSGCKLISYCGPEHQRTHWRIHKNFCKTVQKTCVDNSVSAEDLYTLCKTDDTTCMPKDAYRQKIFSISIHIERELNRQLDRLETLMVLNPKKCQKCFHINNIKKELVCRKCCTVAYCSEEHQEQDKDSHQQICGDFQKLLKMETFYRKPIPFGVSELKNVIYLENLDMQRFIKQHLNPKLNAQQEAVISYEFTALLTFSYAMRQFPSFKDRKTFTVHIVGARIMFELSTIDQWKYLSIFFGNLQTATLVFVGPQLCRTGETQIELFRPYGSKKATTLIHCQFHNCLDHEAFNKELIGKPDVIVAFNSGLYDQASEVIGGYSWGPTISLFLKFKTPIICTAYMKEEAKLDIGRITRESAACGVKIKVISEAVENPYRSLRPFRFQDAVAYKNRFLSVLDVSS